MSVVVGLRSRSSSEATSFSSRPLPVSPSDSESCPFNTAAAWVVERTTTIRGSHFYNHMLRLCSVSFLLFPYYAVAPRAPLFPLLCRHIRRLPSCETWLLDASCIQALERFQCEIGRRILKLSKFHANKAVRIGLHWPTMSTRILLR